VHTLHKIFKMTAFLGFGLALLWIIVMQMVTAEWTCFEAGGTWSWVGPQCNAEGTKRFDTYRRSVTCERTDWAGQAMNRFAGIFYLPRHRDPGNQPGA
jgi:hypothetical protein